VSLPTASVIAAYPWLADRFELAKEQDGSRFVTARCPLHEGFALRLWLGLDGQLLFGCYAGCTTEGSPTGKLEILRAVGASWKMCYPEKQDWKAVRAEITARYPYYDENKKLLYETIRLEPGRGGRDKDFRQRRPVGGKGWEWNLDGARRVLYRLPDLIAPEARGKAVVVVAGEKDADSLARTGVLGTTNVCGERADWIDEYSAVLAGRDVIVVEDRDAPGRRHANEAVGSILGAGPKSLRRCALPEKDTTAFLTALRIHGVTAPDELRQALQLAMQGSPKWQAATTLTRTT